MKKVDLRMNELYKYEIIKKVVNNKLNRNSACVRIGCSLRNINRLINRYEEFGKNGFIHGNRGMLPSTTISDELKSEIISLYKDKYLGSNFKHFNELLKDNESIFVSESFIRTLMKANNIISPKANRKTKREYNKMIKDLSNTTIESSSDIVDNNVSNLIPIEDSHPRRPRSKYMGELIQLDASDHNWFGDNKSHLHAAIDDASGKIVGLHFETQETLVGYYNVYSQILNNYGIPYEFLTDRRTVFEYQKKNVSSIEKDTFTQFGYACNQLGTKISTSSVPQAKGRVERLFNTLQSRLIIEMRLENILTIEEANNFLPRFVDKFNKKFSLHLNDNMNVFERVENIDDIELILSTLATRKIDNGHCLSYKSQYYYPVDDKGNIVTYRARTKCMVIKTFTNKLFVSIGESIHELKELDQNYKLSKDFDQLEIKKRAKAGSFTPAMTHPWKSDSFKKYCAKLKHIKTKEFEQMFN